MFFTKKGLVKQSKYGRIYVFRFTLSCGKVVHKVGMTHSDRATDRMFEVLRSFFNVFRYVPKCELRKDKKVLIPLLVEKHLHKLLNDWSYRPDLPFDGSTEFFEDIDESILLTYLTNFSYTELLKNVTEIDETSYDLIKEAIQSEIHTQDDTQVDDIIPF